MAEPIDPPVIVEPILQHTRVYVDALGLPIHVATSEAPFAGDEPIQSASIAGVRVLTFKPRVTGFIRARGVLNLLEPATPQRLRWKPAASGLISDSAGDVNPI